MLKIKRSSKFKKDYRIVQRRGYDIKLFEDVIEMLINQQPLPEKHRDHQLKGDYEGYRECHISPDWLIIYKVVDDRLFLLLARTGTHSDLF